MSIWARYRGAATWVKIAVPIAIVAALVGLGAIIANALSDDSTTTSGSTTTTAGNGTTALLLVATAGQLASDEASTATTTTIPLATTVPEPTTTIPEPTTATTSAPETTTTVASTTVPATTAPTVAPTEPTTAPPDTTTPTTEKPTTTTEKAATTTEKATTTTQEAATTTEKATTTTEKSSTTTSVFPLPPGQVAASADAFMATWNAAAPASGVATISTWTEKPLAGHEANVATLGGNLRIVVLTADGSPTSPVSMAVLAWLPLSNPSEQAAQNEAFQQAFGVLMKTVSATVTSEQEATVAQQLGLSAATPPFPDGTTATASLDQKDYQLRALIPAGQSGVYSLVGVSAAP